MASEPALPPIVRHHLEKRDQESSFCLQAEAALARIPPGASPVLDLGCGTAPLAPRLIARGHEYVGADRDPAMVAGANRRLGEGPGRVALADARELPFPDRYFGAVASLGLFEYLDEPIATLSEVRRVLRPGGPAVLTVPRREAPYRRAQAVAAPVLRALGRTDPFDLRSGRNVTPDLLESWAADAGLHVTARAHVAPAVLPWPVDRLLPGLARRLAQGAGSRYGTMRLFVLMRPSTDADRHSQDAPHVAARDARLTNSGHG
jgi:SAM-dependent methyltransferase